MFIQRILTTAVLAELLLFLMVANCAPSRPREDAGRVPGNPASSYVPSVFNSLNSGSSSSSNIIKNGHKRKAIADRIDSTTLILKDPHPPNDIAGFRRVYRWSTGCSSVQPGGGLLRFLHNGVDARGGSTDPDTDIELSSVDSDGKVYIISKTRKHYLCFNKKGHLVTKKRPGGDKTLCQFYETLWRGNRRFVSVYRRHHQDHQEPQTQQPMVPWAVPLPGSADRSSWKDGGSSQSPAFDIRDHPQDWHVGFDQSGKPLKGSAWRNSIYRPCFDLVEHVDHVHSSGVRPSPIGDNQMSMIFQSENSVPEPMVETSSSGKSRKGSSAPAASKNNKNSPLHPKAKSSKTGENVKSVGKNSLGRSSSVNHKNVATSSHGWKSSGSGANNKRNNKIHHHSSGTTSSGASRNSEEQGRARKPKSEKVKGVTTTEKELLAPVEFWKTKSTMDDAVVAAPASANVDFDSYLAETEQLLAHPEQVIGHSQDFSAASSSSTPSPAQRSAFIHLDTGGWEEVVYSKSSDSTPAAPILHQKEDFIIIDDKRQVGEE